MKAIEKLLDSPNCSPSENVGVKYYSHIIDHITYLGGGVDIIDHGHNVMLNSFLPLLTNLLVNGTGALKYWAIGIGESGWDIALPSPLATQVLLVNEACRKEIASSVTYPNDGIFFIDSEGERSVTPSNIIEIQLTFGANEGLSDGVSDTPWREFGIVGGSGATSVKDSGTFMNTKNHGTLTKTSTMIVERKIRFTFTNAN